MTFQGEDASEDASSAKASANLRELILDKQYQKWVFFLFYKYLWSFSNEWLPRCGWWQLLDSRNFCWYSFLAWWQNHSQPHFAQYSKIETFRYVVLKEGGENYRDELILKFIISVYLSRKGFYLWKCLMFYAYCGGVGDGRWVYWSIIWRLNSE